MTSTTISFVVADKTDIEPAVLGVDESIRKANADFRELVVGPAERAAAADAARKASLEQQNCELGEIVQAIPKP